MPDASLGSAGGPVSAALEEELRGELRKGIVVWLDKDGLYTDFVDQLALRHVAGEFPVPVVGFRGSFLKTLFALEPYGSSLDNLPLLVHMPGFNEETIRATPVLELYDPGIRFRKSLDTLVREAARGRVAPDEVERFLLTAPKTVAEADAWLVGQMSSATEGFAARLDHVGLSVVLDGLLGKTASSRRRRRRRTSKPCAATSTATPAWTRHGSRSSPAAAPIRRRATSRTWPAPLPVGCWPSSTSTTWRARRTSTRSSPSGRFRCRWSRRAAS